MSSGMSLEFPQASGFTFQSSVHSAHVLRCLHEQRQRDTLCDVTVMVENQSFHAHRAVLAACSDYFQSRVTSHGGEGQVITLPEEVTVKGFEPLLEFAYTAKLFFTKENIVEIHNCATFLGFHNLDKACFEFLLPKFLDRSRDVQGIHRKVCCKQRLQRANFGIALTEDIGEGSTLDTTSPQVLPESVEIPCSIAKTPVELPDSVRRRDDMEAENNCALQSSKSSLLQAACGRQNLCLQNCGPQMPFGSPAVTDAGETPPCLSCPSEDCEDAAKNVYQNSPEMSDVCPTEAAGCLPCVTLPQESPDSVPLDAGSCEPCRSSALEAECCPVGSFEGLDASVVSDSSSSLELNGSDTVTGIIPSTPVPPCPSQEKAGGERSSVEREVAEHLAKGFWPDPCPSQSEPLLLYPAAQSTLDKATDFHWLKQLDLSSSTGDCPFLRNLGAEETQLPDSEHVSQPAKSPYISSVNSADDSDFDMEGDSDSFTERAREVALPFPADQISSLSRNDFQQLLKMQSLTQKQLDFVHDVRRRSKNRIAAQRCRKRKLDCIQNLECEIDRLNSEKEKLLQEQTQLQLCMEETLQSLSGLCQEVCGETTLRLDQLQLLAKYSSLERLLSPSGTLSPSTVAGGPENNGPPAVYVDFSTTEQLSVGDGVAASQQPTPPGCGPNDSTPRAAVCPDPVACGPISVMGVTVDRNGTCVTDASTHPSLPFPPNLNE